MRHLEGYNAENLQGFAKELAKARPDLDLPSPDKPAAWYKLLRGEEKLIKKPGVKKGWYKRVGGDEELWEMWLTWRERKWTDFMVRLQKAVKAANPNLEVGSCTSNMNMRGLWNTGMLAEAGITAHAPHCNFPNYEPYWTTFIARDWYRKRYGFEPVYMSMHIWWRTNHEPEQVISSLFAPVKVGGTRRSVWCDWGYRWNRKENKPIAGAKTSVITDMLERTNGGQQARAFERAARQIRRLPYKDRFDLYERYGGTLPLEFAIDWNEDDGRVSVKSVDGIAAGDPHKPVYGVVQDWHPNGYVEMLLFNDVHQSGRRKHMQAVVETAHPFTFEPGSLRERVLTVAVRCEKDIVPFVDGRPWVHYERQGDRLIVNSIPFEAQQVRLLQLTRCGRQLPHVKNSRINLSNTMLNVQKRIMWLKFIEPQAGKIMVQCADWGEPQQIRGGKLEHFDKDSSLAEVSVDATAVRLVISWRQARTEIVSK